MYFTSFTNRFPFYNYYSFNITYSLSSFTIFHQTLIHLHTLLYIQFTFIQHNILSLFFHHLSPNSHSNRYTYLQDSISTFTTIIQFTFIQHNILSPFLHQLSFKSIYLFTRLYFHFYNYSVLFNLHSFNITYSLSSFTIFHQTLIQIDILIYKTLFPLLQLSFNLHSFNITYSLPSFTKLSFKSIYLFTKLYFHFYNKCIIQFTFIQHNILSLFFHHLSPNSHSNRYTYLQDSISTFTTIIQFTFIQHNILSLSPNSHSNRYTYLQLSLFFHHLSPNSHSNRYTYLQDSISTFNNYHIHST